MQMRKINTTNEDFAIQFRRSAQNNVLRKNENMRLYQKNKTTLKN